MPESVITTNRKAGFNYELLERFEAGLALTGSEVKSLRNGRANLTDAYALIKGNELWLINCHISEYAPAAFMNHPPRRTRKLLLHRQQIERMTGQLQQKGLTLIPTKLYWKKGRAKCELALARGKKLFDKRETIKQRETQREVARALRGK
ncbi:MAG: SsrA-binding protein SmpB [Deltaproteobacteria bacterium]|nr:SsrA-binding protein SmpB [Deltaproteobacteria bacterium]